jgi:signal transduction histidine kinase
MVQPEEETAASAVETTPRMLESWPLPAAWVLPTGVLRHANARLCQAVGLPLNASADRFFADLFAQEDQPRIREALQRVLMSQEDRSLCLAKLLKAEGASATTRVAVARVSESRGPELLISIDPCELWSEELDVKDELEAQRRRWQEAEQARDTFLSIACHELKTPLSALQLQVQGLLRLDPKSPEELPRIQTMKQTLDRLAQLIDNLLDISRLRLGKILLQEEPVDLIALVREVTVRCADELQRAGCSVSVHAQGNLVGRWDRMRLEQVVANLVQNAAKYGRGAPIQITLEANHGVASLSVRDHGIGIAPKDHERIFEPFERAVTGRSVVQGFGLGLWIVRQFLFAMGGQVCVQSRVGEGAVFLAELPLEPPSVPDPEVTH